MLCGAFAPRAAGIDIVLDYTLDELNENWFDTGTSAGLARRAAVDTAAGFLSEIITNDDWNALATLNESFSLVNVAASSITNLSGAMISGTAEADGDGFSYNISTTNRSSVGVNEYIVYVGAFEFDAGTTSHANGGWDSNDRRNTAGVALLEFNTWGGRIVFDTGSNWYAGLNPGIDPTDDYGFQDPDKTPSTDITTDNWDWSTSTNSWKGFDLRTLDTSAIGRPDLYASALHELMHALGATSSNYPIYVGLNASGELTGANVTAEFGADVPMSGSHFVQNIQSIVWDSGDIVSEGVLDPNSLNGTRKYLTNLDAALLRDLGYDVISGFPNPVLVGDYNDNGAVDAADYTVWRNHLGETFQLLNEDPAAPDGMVTQADYLAWRSHYGATSGGAPVGAAGPAVPEPSAAWMFALGSAVCFSARRRTAAANR